jgi:hypothetical protein
MKKVIFRLPGHGIFHAGFKNEEGKDTFTKEELEKTGE